MSKNNFSGEENVNKYCGCDSCQNVGGFSRLIYDECEFNTKTRESVSPMQYQLTAYKHENKKACVENGTYFRPFDLVDQESELKNITRAASLCPSKKYSPNCKRSAHCTSTFEPNMPVVVLRNVCPVVCTNMKQRINSGLPPMSTTF